MDHLSKMKVNAQSTLSSDLFANIERQVEEEAARKDARRRALREKNISADVRIVAWIDILGFSQMLQRASSDAEMREIYHKLLFVQEQFGAVSASDDPETTQTINVDYGRAVVALSDGLVVTASLNAKARAVMTPYDLLMSFIGEIVEAQANCAANGIFLRGGISVGPYYYDNNVLLSPALIRAYKLETERASYPVIIVNRADVEALRQLPGIRRYAPDAEPSLAYFRPFKSPAQRRGERFFFLHYLGFLSHPDNHGWFSHADRERYAKSSGRNRSRVFTASHRKMAAHFMRRHKKHVTKAYLQTSSESIRAKYRWLVNYHSKTIRGYPSVYDKAQFKLPRFSRSGD